jgi:hypothetical protein
MAEGTGNGDQRSILGEGNQSEIPAKMCLISGFQEAQYPLLADLLQISMIKVDFSNKANRC